VTTPLSPVKSRRRWLQYSLRTLLVVTTLCAVACSWLGVKLQQARRQREAVEVIVKLGGSVAYDWEYDANGLKLNAKPPGQGGLPGLLGDDFFQTVRVVNLARTQATDASLEHLSGLRQVQYLTLGGTKVTDAGMERLVGLSQLHWLFLDDTQVTDAGLAHLECLSQLQRLILDGTKVSDAGVKKLQAALPNCSIHH
jgi:hypothetical protein